MPRRAAADVVVPIIEEVDRPPPPADMSEAAAVVWRSTVANMSAKWFTPETHSLLGTYCTLTAEIKRLEVEFTRLDVTDPQYERLTARHDKMAAQALSYARALRLTPRANQTARDARDAQRSNSPKPWQL